MRTSYGSGALRPPPPVVAPLVPRCALLPAATPRMMGLRQLCTFEIPNRCARRRDETFGVAALASAAFRRRTARTRGVGAGRSAQRGTSEATTGPRGAAGPHNPDYVMSGGLQVGLLWVQAWGR